MATLVAADPDDIPSVEILPSHNAYAYTRSFFFPLLSFLTKEFFTNKDG
jgi:hypothetical protein